MTPRQERYDNRIKLYDKARVGLYNAANQACINARATERHLLVERLQLVPGLSICDTVSGGGYVAEGIRDIMGERADIICIEPSINFARSIDPDFQPLSCPLDAIALDAASVDRVCNLAGIHHIDRREDFFAEAFRILKPGGRFAIADVLDGSPPAQWLNVEVDRLSDIGHDGTFLEHGALTQLLEQSGFADVEEQYERYTWDFPDHDTMVGFCKDLFRLSKASLEETRDALHRTLKYTITPDSCRMEWSLVYASGKKA